MVPVLNYKELALLIEKISPEIQGLFIERVIVPERPEFPQSFLKGEWAIRLSGRNRNNRQTQGHLVFSVRSGQPYLAWDQQRELKTSSHATRSAFDLVLLKHLKGSRVLEVNALPKERIVVFWFKHSHHSHLRVGLILVLIPAHPEALLVEKSDEDQDRGWLVIASSRAAKNIESDRTFVPPKGASAPDHLPIRKELIESPSAYFNSIESELRTEAFTQRVEAATRTIQRRLKLLRTRLKDSRIALSEVNQEANWKYWADLLKANLHHSPTLDIDFNRKVHDYQTDQDVLIPCDPKLSLVEQTEKFYQNFKRSQRKQEESKLRIEETQNETDLLTKLLAQKLNLEDWAALKKMEESAKSLTPAFQKSKSDKKKKSDQKWTWTGKIFTSIDDLPICVGRTSQENLELTFKHTRGNDIWMHVRGKPGAHVVIQIPHGKSAPLETLLDGATLAIYYSKGENWGKTEIDYTFKKYVKRIKDSNEVSYTHNKSLIVQIDPERLKRLQRKACV